MKLRYMRQFNIDYDDIQPWRNLKIALLVLFFESQVK